MRTPHARPLARAAATALAAALALSACSAGSGTGGDAGGAGGSASGDAAGQGSADTTLDLGLALEPVSLDFTTTSGAAIGQALLGNVYETLVTTDEKGQVVPALAEKVDVSKDRRTYTFTLPEGLTFSDGKPLTSSDVVYSIERVKKEWTNGQKSAMDVVAKAQAKGDRTVVVTLSRPSNQWLFAMTTVVGAVFSEDADPKGYATKPVGSGPYAFADWKRGDRITLARNERYRGEKPYFEKAVFRYMKDPTALTNAMLTQSLDVLTTVQAPESLGQFEGKEGLQVIKGTTNGEVLLSFNHEGVLKDRRLRQGIRHAIDHPALRETCWAGQGTDIGSMVPPTDPWYEDRTGDYPHDMEKAKALIADAKPAKALRLRVPNLPYATECGQVVKSQLEDAGLKVTLDQMEFPTWLEQVFTGGDYDMSIVAHVEPRDLPRVFGDKAYYLRYDSPQVRKALAAADAGTPEQQTERMKEAARLISEDAAADWLFLLPNLMVADADITGLPEDATRDFIDLAALKRG